MEKGIYMKKRRTDSKGRSLKQGESQRKNDKLYQYRFVDELGNRRTIYDRTLDGLRAKEAEIQKARDRGLKLSTGADVTVGELVDKFMELNTNWAETTYLCRRSIIRRISADPISKERAADIKVSDAKRWIVGLYRKGTESSAIMHMVTILRQSFQMAYEDDLLNKNPFAFSLHKVVPLKFNTREALTESQQRIWMDFMRRSVYKRYYDINVVLLGTGLRCAEFCGLTVENLDFENQIIKVDRQLKKFPYEPPRFVAPKTPTSVRKIPMLPEVYDSLKRILADPKRPAVQKYSAELGELVLTKENGSPYIGSHLNGIFGRAYKRFKRDNPSIDMPPVTPHVLRHTFATNMANAGIKPKSLQYLMGHTDPVFSMRVYAHSNLEQVKKEFSEVKPALTALKIA